MPDREKYIEILCKTAKTVKEFNEDAPIKISLKCVEDILELLKEQEKKQTLHKKHVITWERNDELSMRKLYETICETLLDEGELFITRTDDHEKVELVFYVADVNARETTKNSLKSD